MNEKHQTLMSLKNQMLCVWGGPFAAVGWFLGFFLIAGLLPPISPNMPVEELKAFYLKDPNQGRVTPELKAELSRAKAERLPNGDPWSRPIAPSRANATAKDIAPKVESVNQTWYAKLWAYVMGIPAAAIGLFKSLFGDYNDPSSYIYQVKSFFSAIPVEYYAFVAAGIAGLILYQATKAQNATVKSYNEGKIN